MSISNDPSYGPFNGPYDNNYKTRYSKTHTGIVKRHGYEEIFVDGYPIGNIVCDESNLDNSDPDIMYINIDPVTMGSNWKVGDIRYNNKSLNIMLYKSPKNKKSK